MPVCKISKQLDNLKSFDQITLLYLNDGIYKYIYVYIYIYIYIYIHTNTVQTF